MDDKRKDTNGLLKEIRDEVKRQNEGSSLEDLENQFKETGKAMFQAIAAGDTGAQKELSAMREALKSQMGVQMAFEKARELEAQRLSALQEEQNKLAMDAAAVTNEDIIKAIENSDETPEDDEESTRKGLFLGLRDFLGNDFKEKFTEGLVNLGEKIKGVGAAGFGKIKDTGKSILDFVSDMAKLAAGAIALMGFLDGWENATKWFGANADFGDKIASALATILGTFLGLSEDMQIQIAQKIAAVIDVFEKMFEGVFDGAKQAIIGLFEGDSSKFISGITQMLDSVVNAFRDLANMVMGVFGISEGSPLYDMVNNVFDRISEFFSGLVTTVTGIFTGDMEMFSGGLNRIITSITGFFGDIANTVLDIFGVGEDSAIRTAVNKIYKSITDVFTGVVDMVTGAFSWLFSDDDEEAKKAGDKAKAGFNKIIDGAIGYLTGILDLVTGVIGAAWDKIVDVLPDWDWLKGGDDEELAEEVLNKRPTPNGQMARGQKGRIAQLEAQLAEKEAIEAARMDREGQTQQQAVMNQQNNVQNQATYQVHAPPKPRVGRAANKIR